MAYAPPDPKKIAAARQVQINAEKAARERADQIRTCYREHSPGQIAQAGEMIQAGMVAKKIEGTAIRMHPSPIVVKA